MWTYFFHFAIFKPFIFFSQMLPHKNEDKQITNENVISKIVRFCNQDMILQHQEREKKMPVAKKHLRNDKLSVLNQCVYNITH